MRRAFAILALFAAAGAFADPQVTVSTDRATVAVNDAFTLTVTAQGSRVAEPIIPHSNDFRFDRTPRFRSSQMSMQIVNGQATAVQSQQWVYRAWAAREGALKIPRIQVRIDGKDYSSEEVPITATAATPLQLQQGAPPDAQMQPAPQPAQTPRGTTRAPTLDDALRIEAETDKKRAYQGEQIVLTLRILKLANPGVMSQSNMRAIALPKTEGFYIGQKRQGTANDSRNGLDYMIDQFQVYLYPTGVGTLTIGEWVWEGVVQAYTDRGPQRKPLNLQTQPIPIEVLPLPNSPKEFSGAVGSFKVRAAIMDAQVMQGVPTRLELRVEGDGNPDAINAPELPEIAWAQPGDPEVETQPPNDAQPGHIVKLFRYPLTPLEAGVQKVPEIRFVYFEPKLGNFRTEKIAPIAVTVRPGAGGGRLQAAGGIAQQAKQDVDILGEDLVPIVTEAPPLRPARSGAAVNTLGIAVPPLSFAAFALLVRRRRRFEQDPEYARHYFARSKSKRRLQGLAQTPEPVEGLYHAVADYLGDKFNAPGAGMTPADAARLLREHRVPETLVEKFVRVLKSCERARYSGGTLNATELEALVQAAEEAMDELDASAGGGKRWLG